MRHVPRTSLFVLVLLASCSREPADFQAALFLFEQNNLEQALPIFEDLAASDAADARTLAYLADTYRRFGKKEKAIITARRALELEPCNSFAHTVIAEASNPLVGEWEGADPETTWVHLLEATQCDPKDGNPWLTLWGESVRRGDRTVMSQAAEKMLETGFFSKALLSYTEWVLTSLPKNAILITNGDMDTYPCVSMQMVEERRPDVVVVNRGMLNEPWCARYLRDVRGVALPVSDAELDRLRPQEREDADIETPSDQIIRGWISMWKQGKIWNPIAFATTVPESYAKRFGEPLQYAGASLLVTTVPDPAPDPDQLRLSLESFRVEDFFGPWVSEQDRSPVRRVGTKNIVRNVIYAAITLADALIEAGKPEEALPWVDFAEGLDKGSDLGSVYAEQIRLLRQKLAP